MKQTNHQNKTFKIPFHDFGGKGEVLHFAHANGFPPGCYQQFLKPFLKQYQVLGMKGRPFWQTEPNGKHAWVDMGDDLIRFLDSQNTKNVIGMGHSMGAVATMLAAVKRPDLFSKLVFIEPVFLMAIPQMVFSKMPWFLKPYVHPFIKTTMKRRDTWESKEVVFKSFRKKRVFAKWSDEVLWDYVNFGTKPNGKGEVTLSFSKEWEAHYYGTVPYVWAALKKVTQTTFGIRGEMTDTILPKAWEKWHKTMPNAQFLEMKNVGHLIPMEAPELLAREVLEFLKT